MGKQTFTIVNYFDVWGSQEDGWQVNDAATRGTVELAEEDDDAAVLAALIAVGCISDHITLENVKFEWEDVGFCEIYARETDEPLGCLQRRDAL